MSAPLIRLEGLTKRFGATAAVDGVDLDLVQGEFFALLGPSGCGKTTLMRLLAGFEAPDRGRILLDGEDLTALPPNRRPVHMMFQSYALFPHLSVARNVGFGLKHLPRAQAAARVEEMLALLQLQGLGDRKPHQLSGGQQQRVALARALAPRPRILLLDEPLAALDRKLREETQGELKALQRKLGLTFLVVTHDQEEAMALADRMAVMQEGRIAQVGTPREIYQRPASRAVAEFFGETNLLADSSGGWLAIRPESIVLQHGPAPEGLSGTIAAMVFLGDRLRVVVETARGPMRVIAPADLQLREGEVVGLSWPASAAVTVPR